MRTVCQTVFLLSELSVSAKESARNWFRQATDNDWYDVVYEDAASVADILGIDIRTRKVQYQSGEVKYDGINIGFSGFSSQGDGAHFEGHYRYAKNASKAIREYAPTDTELHRIADKLQALQRKHFYGLKASVKHSGHYSHEYCTEIEIEMADDRYGNQRYPSMTAQEDVAVLLRDFMRWIYRALEKEWDYQNSDEVVDENIEANGFEFTNEGRRTMAIKSPH